MQKILYAKNQDATHQIDDNMLLASIKQGDNTAFAILVRRHTSKFYRLAYRFMNNQAESEDIVQEAFLKLWENPYSWNENKGSSFTTWFYRVVVNLCMDHMKKKRPLPLDEKFQIVDNRANQEENLIKNQRGKKLEEQISALPIKQRTALNLCFYEGLSNQEAADIMGLKLKALQSLLVRAKLTLKDKLRS